MRNLLSKMSIKKITFKSQIIKIKLNQLHAVSRTQQGRQRDPSVASEPSVPSEPSVASEPSEPSVQNSAESGFCRILKALRVEWQNSTPPLTSTPERRCGNINLSKYFISSSGDRTHNPSVLQSHLVPLRHDWPLKSQISYCQIVNINK